MVMKARCAAGFVVLDGPYTLARASLCPPHVHRPPASLPSPSVQRELCTHSNAPLVTSRSLTSTAAPALPDGEEAHKGEYGATWWCWAASSSCV